MVIPVLANYVNGQWVTPNAAESLEVRNPATAEILARVPMSSAADVAEAVRSADRAF